VTIEQISRLSTRQQRSELAGGQFMQIENGNILGLETRKRMRIGGPNIPEWLSEHEIQINLEVT
jgi:hypothetical protein